MTSAAPGTAGQRTGLLSAPGLLAAARTDCGPVREVNEDAFLCRPDLGVFAVIDGMGGHRGGRVAAVLMRDALLEESDLPQALATANERIHARARTDTALAGMGCVVSAVKLAGGDAQIAHVGDTRVYLTSDAGCEQLTRDHTVAAVRQEELGISERRARDLEGQHQVTRDIGGQPRQGEAWIDRLDVGLHEQDLLLLCSDGLHGAIPRDELCGLLRRARRDAVAPEALVEELVERALAEGTRDNVTVVVVRWLQPTAAGREEGETWMRRLWRGLGG